MLLPLSLISVMFAAFAGLAYLDYRECVCRDRQKNVAVVASGWLAAKLLTNGDK